MRRKIGLFCRSFGPTEVGGAIDLVNLAEYLSRHDYEVILYSNEFDEGLFPQLKDFEKRFVPKLVVLKNSTLQLLIDVLSAFILFLRYPLKKEGIQIIIANDLYHVVYMMKSIFRVPCILYLYRTSKDRLTKNMPSLKPLASFVSVIERTIYSRVEEVIVSSETVQRQFSTDLGIKPEIAYCPIDLSLFKPSWDKKTKNLILSVSRLVPSKGHDRLIKLLQKIQEDHLLVIVGTTNPTFGEYLSKLRALADSEPNVFLLENLSTKELVELYQRAAIYCHVSMTEGFGNTPVEAMACGTPVVAFKGGAVMDTVVDRQTGFLVNNEEDYIYYIQKLLSDDGLRMRMGEAAVNYVQGKFDPIQFFEKMTGKIRTLIGDNRFHA